MEKTMNSNLEELIIHEVTGDPNSYDYESITAKYWPELDVDTPSEKDIATIESVCGLDERVKVTNTRVMPYQAICKLYMRTKTGKNYIGSGFITHSNKVVTAGHCVYDHREGGWMESIIVVPGKNGASEPYGRHFANKIAAVRDWIENKSERYDMGVILLNSNVDHSGRIQMELTDSDRGKISGYPADRDRGIFQYTMENTLQNIDGRFHYSIDTYGGQSGCPLLKNSSTGIGIHNYGSCPNKASDFYQKFIDEVDTF
jgi:V8-like Glu-specific endopeptidase